MDVINILPVRGRFRGAQRRTAAAPDLLALTVPCPSALALRLLRRISDEPALYWQLPEDETPYLDGLVQMGAVCRGDGRSRGRLRATTIGRVLLRAAERRRMQPGVPT